MASSQVVLSLLTLTLLFAVSWRTVSGQEPAHYVSFLNGSLNLILSAPHGGSITPPGIPVREAGCFIDGSCVWKHNCGSSNKTMCPANVEQDYNTYNLTLLLREKLHALTGRYPCVVINNLKRSFYDANRNLSQATFEVPEIVPAFEAYHRYVDECAKRFSKRGLFLDIHGQSHKEAWLELGYLPTGQELDQGSYSAADTSLRQLADLSGTDITRLVAGDMSLGRHMEDVGIATVPSPARAGPGGADYFSGNFNILRHGSKLDGGNLDAIQVESPYIRRKPDAVEEWAELLAEAVVRFMEKHYALERPSSSAEELRLSGLVLLLAASALAARLAD